MTSLEPYIKDVSVLYMYTIHGSPKRGYNQNGNYPIGVYQGRFVKLKPSKTVIG
jgi:hypothetical protein